MKCKICGKPADAGYQGNALVGAPWNDMKPMEWYCVDHHPQAKAMGLVDFNLLVRELRVEVAGLQLRIASLEAAVADLRKELVHA